ncbi:MAG: acyltransferase [Alphaproteobacteria bacterium]|nr:acyltransferase [Alphaproteobacteria bacterium]
MRKKKVKAGILILTALLLFLTKFLYSDALFKVTIQTDKSAGTFEMEYVFAKKAVRTKMRITKEQRASVRIYADSLTALKLFVPTGMKVLNIKIEGSKTTVLDVKERYDFENLSLKAKRHFDFKIFVIAAFLFYAVLDSLLSRAFLFDDKIPSMMNLEFLRLIFTIGIVVYHLSERLDMTTEGWLGVEFFFILSGFFLTLTFNPERSVPSFVKSKIIHFTPLLLLCSLFGKAKIIAVLSNVLFLQCPELSDEVTPPQAWFLAVLFWVGLFYFYMMKICSAKSNKAIFALLTFFAYSACRHYGWGETPLIGGIVSVRLLRGVAGIGLGYFTALFYQSLQNKPLSGKLFFSIMESILLFYCAGLVFFNPLCPENKIVAAVAFASLILLFSLKRGGISRLFEKPFFARLSACSFAVYMTHWILLMDVVLRWYKRSAFLQDHLAAVIVIAVVLSYILGLFVHQYIEKPLGGWLKKKWN